MARTIFDQTGWRGSLPASICQDQGVLLAITEYSFDLKNSGFENYMKGRTGMCLAEVPDPKYREACIDFTITKEEFLKRFRVVREHGHENMVGKALSDDHLEISWEILKMFHGKAQDCWEIYKGIR